MSDRPLDMLNKGVMSWNNWRAKYPHQKVNLSGEKLMKRNLRGFDLRNVDLREADLTRADLTNAKLEGASLEKANLYQTKLPKQNLSGTNFNGADLSFSDLTESVLTGAKFNQANLKGAKLHNADLTKANLTETLFTDTDFSNANLTGACIENWRVSRETNLKNVVCHYVYLKTIKKDGRLEFEERRPSDENAIFAPGEFAALVKKVVETIDLIFSDGIDWQVFFSGFQELREKYKDYELNIQAIERKGKDFIVRLEVLSTAEKSIIESKFRFIYDEKIKRIKEGYEKKLRLKQEYIEFLQKTLDSLKDSKFFLEDQLRRKSSSLADEEKKRLKDSYEQKLKEKKGYIECLERKLEDLRGKQQDIYENHLQQSTNLIEIVSIMAKQSSTLTGAISAMANNQRGTTINVSDSNIVGGITTDNALHVGGNDNSIVAKQSIGGNIGEIRSLIDSIRDNISDFPAEQREEAQAELDDLEFDVSTSEKIDINRFKKQLKVILGVGTALLALTGGAVDFSKNVNDLTDNVLSLGEKVGITSEQIKPSP